MELKLTAYEQDALAAFAQAASAVQWAINQGNDPTEKQIEAFSEIVDRFDKINWGTVYDKLHRSGANA